MNIATNTLNPDDAQRFRADVLVPLRRVGRSLRWRLILSGLAACGGILAACLAGQALLDMTFVLGTGPRAALLLVVLVALALAVRRRLILPASRRISPDDIASLLERAEPTLHDALSSAVSFVSHGTSPTDSPAMVAAVIKQARDQFRSLHPRTILNDRRHRLALMAIVTLASCAALVFWSRAEWAATFLARNVLLQDVAWPSRTRIRLEGAAGNRITWAVGDDLTLVATAEGVIPSALRAEIALANGQSALRDMARRGEDQFILDYGPLAASMNLRFRIGRFGVDETTSWYTVDAVERPAIREAQVAVVPPAYTQLEPFNLPPGQTSAEVLPGALVTLSATTNKPVVSADLRFADTVVAQAERRSELSIAATFEPVKSGVYHFDLRDTGGLTDLHPVTFAIRLAADPPPKIRLSLPGCGDMVVVNAVLDIEVECADNLGLRHAELLYTISPADAPTTSQLEAQTETLRGFDPGAEQFNTRISFPLSALSAKTGEQVRLWLRADDYQPTIGDSMTGTSQSPPHVLRVVSPEELLAELGRRESEWRREFEFVLKSQEGIAGRVHDLHDQARTASPGALGEAYSREETGQRSQLGRLKTIRRQFEQILAELKLNQLADATVRKRLDGGVIQPLGRLIFTDVPSLADQMERLRGAFDPGSAEQIEQAHAGLLQTMRDILANMLKWEGYNEAVGLLRDVIRLQDDVNRETRQRLDKQVEDLFKRSPRERLKEE